MLEPIEIVKLALGLGAIVVSVVVGLTGAFKKFFPTAEPLFFSIPAGFVITALAWFATQPVPTDLPGWAAFVLVEIIGALLPSGLFDAGVNFAKKVDRGYAVNLTANFSELDSDCPDEAE